MPLAFGARQQLRIPVSSQSERLTPYLENDDRIVSTLLAADQLQRLGDGRYRYAVQQLNVFQLQVQPIVQLQATRQPGRLEIEALDCQLEGLDAVDDFALQLHSHLVVSETGLEGEAHLAVTVSRPAILGLLPPRVLEATGRSLLAGILIAMRKRVGRQLLDDFSAWCQEN
ncbi:MAG: DUF1997 domain-containing protein [Cyanobacteria bacterium]|nr:DUF1997 domain-containing protein [Cyanobacteria bacterium bin.51]